MQGREGHCKEEGEKMITDIGKIPFSSFSSSHPHPNGRWGALVHDKHQRVWLGTFESDKEAVRSYDRATVEFMDLSQTNNSDVAPGDSDAGGSSCAGGCVEKEHMFDKVVTPSDVGKLNRLVIPKQHAEKYFPLDSTNNAKGLLLNFEDRGGKPWRFRYSYWNSSQSYVMTKGWSRFVKEKKLDAGDIVSFERGVGEIGKNRLYIDWRRRPDAPELASQRLLPFRQPLSLPRSVPWSGLFLPTPTPSVPSPELVHFQQLNYERRYNKMQRHHHSTSGSVLYVRSSAPQHGGVVQQGGDVPIVIESVPVVNGKPAGKRVRLFGVNLECPISEDDPECEILSSSTTTVVSSLSPQLPPSSLTPLQLRLYNGAPLPTTPAECPKKGRQSLSFNLHI